MYTCLSQAIGTGIGCDPEPEETTRNTGYHGDYYALKQEVGYSKRRGDEEHRRCDVICERINDGKTVVAS